MNVRHIRLSLPPEGDIDVSQARAAVFSALMARRFDSGIVFRIDDTALEPGEKNRAEAALDLLEWLGLFDKETMGGFLPPRLCSEHLESYTKARTELRESGFVYPCFCDEARLSELVLKANEDKKPLKYDSFCLKLSPEDVRERLERNEEYRLRLRMPSKGPVQIIDPINGPMRMNSAVLGDFVIWDAVGPTPELTALVDSAETGVDLVCREEKRIPESVKEIFIGRSLNVRTPHYLHLPTLEFADGPDSMETETIGGLREKGYDPEALFVWLGLMNWDSKRDGIPSPEEIFLAFDPKAIRRPPVRCDRAELNRIQSVVGK